ncbi:MAG: asparaginase [Alphaproteobacteria bacterium]|nr:asparaginase [Alphaproteobacteria bacterium]
MHIPHIILTGGTINKIYDPVTEKPEIGPASIIPDYIERSIRPHTKPGFETLMLKDSLFFTKEDRATVLKAVNAAPSTKIIILHGTGTMQITAEYLHKNLGPQNPKTIILTGSIIPLKEFADSDGGFNLGFALGKIDTLAPGVYIGMNAHIFPAGTVRKNTKTAQFENL